MIYLTPSRNKNDIGKDRNLGLIYVFGSGSVGHQHLSKTVWAADNGCFVNPDIDTEKYLNWLKKLIPFQQNCLFATAPDVVGNARETWKRSEDVLPKIRELGYQAALVAQNGMEDYPIRWGSFDVLFIGGTNDWKLSEESYQIAREAKLNGCRVHMGRVNSRRRLRIACLAGCDSADGKHLIFKPDERLAQLKKWMDEIRRQPFLAGL